MSISTTSGRDWSAVSMAWAPVLFLLWILLASVHLLRRTWHSPAPVARAHATAGT